MVDMVNKEVFTEYRDARFMREFFDDPEKWERLKTHEKGIASGGFEIPCDARGAPR